MCSSCTEVAGNRPLDPSGPPVLLPDSSSDRVGQFTVDLTGTLPRKQLPTADGVDNGTTAAINPVTFLFRFEEMTSHNVSYIWQVSMMLNNRQTLDGVKSYDYLPYL